LHNLLGWLSSHPKYYDSINKLSGHGGSIMKSEYHIGVWDVQFYLIDKEGNPKKDDNGNVIVYELPKADWGHLADICEVDELEEVGVKEK